MVFDRGYTDYQWYQELTEEGVRFVTRLKRGAVIHPGAKRRGRKSPGVLEDRKIQLKGVKGTLCKVRFLDESTGEEYEFLTNAPGIPATTVAALYKERWQVELFFKWIKQHLKLKFRACSNLLLARYCPTVTAFRFAASQWQRT